MCFVECHPDPVNIHLCSHSTHPIERFMNDKNFGMFVLAGNILAKFGIFYAFNTTYKYNMVKISIQISGKNMS